MGQDRPRKSVTQSAGRNAFVRIFGSAIIVQGLISATNLIVGLILIRKTSNADYGYFILISSAALLLASLQSAFIQPPMVLKMNQSNETERAELFGGLYREQRKILVFSTVAGLFFLFAFYIYGTISDHAAILGLATITMLSTAMYREFFRMILLSCRRPDCVLKADLCYVTLVLIGVPIATQMTTPAAFAAMAISLAAFVGGTIASSYLWRNEPRKMNGPTNMLRKMAPIGNWSALGSGTHWAFSQGYNYVVAATMEASAVAALAATRLLMMPINLLSSGISSQMFPTAATWLLKHGSAVVFRRLLLIASGLGALTLCYCASVWLFRDLIFEKVMHKTYPQSDVLILLWSAVILVMVFRDQIYYLLAAAGKHRVVTFVTASSAVIALIVGYIAITHYGAVGAPVGVLTGELCNLCGIVLLCLHQIRKSRTGSDTIVT
jgi:O-antigen/teichoic acid export membrane protein